MVSLPSFLSCGVALLLGAALYWKRRSAPLLFRLLPAIIVVGGIQGLYGFGSVFQGDHLWWKRFILVGELAFPVTIGYVGQHVLRMFGDQASLKASWLWRMIAAIALVLAGAVLVFPNRLMQEPIQGSVVFTRSGGVVVWGFVLSALVMGLSQLERIFRATRDPFRYQLKYVFLGLGGLAGIGIAQASQMLLLPVWPSWFGWFSGVASLFALLLIGFGLARWRIDDFRQKVHVSHQALYTSFTFLIVGGYLIAVGLVAQVLRQTGWELKEALSLLVLFLSAMALVYVGISRQARLTLREFVDRHFFRSKYDYRLKWLEVTERFSACRDMDAVWDRYLEWLGQTFGAPRISIWKRFEVDGRFHQIRSLNTEPPPPPLSEDHPLIQQVNEQSGPVRLEHGEWPAGELEAFGEGTQAHVCVPILRKTGDIIAFCTLSRNFHRRDYDQDDFDLLRVMAHHVAMLLIQFELQEERSIAAKWEAVHRFSGFYLHDLKNLAGGLSLVVQNAEHYGNDPDFQASALRTVKTTAQRIMELMRQLAGQARNPSLAGPGRFEPLDINGVIREVLQGINGERYHPVFHAAAELPPVKLDRESFKQVILNLVLNARQAMEEQGTLGITTALVNGRVMVEVADTGPGIPPDRLEHVFEPFYSTKKSGLGVGLFQCKRIVEEHGGRIRVESCLGRGTTMVITLPAVSADRVEEGMGRREA